MDSRLADLLVQVKEDVVDRVGPVLRRQVGQHLLGRGRHISETEIVSRDDAESDRDVDDTFRLITMRWLISSNLEE